MSTKTALNPVKVTACLKIADKLLQANNTVTTLEIKVALQKDPIYSDYYWDQDLVHDIMDEAFQQGKFKIVQDNGTYRTYSAINLPSTLQPTLPATKKARKPGSGRPKGAKNKTKPVMVQTTTPTPVAKPAAKKVGKNYLSRAKALDLMKNHNKGHFFTVSYGKKNGDPRTHACKWMKDQKDSALGYVLVKIPALLKAGDKAIRSVNLQTLNELKIGGVTYTIR